VNDGRINFVDLAFGVIAACCVWALIHGWG
jgi:hypothetical protein